MRNYTLTVPGYSGRGRALLSKSCHIFLRIRPTGSKRLGVACSLILSCRHVESGLYSLGLECVIKEVRVSEVVSLED